MCVSECWCEYNLERDKMLCVCTFAHMIQSDNLQAINGEEKKAEDERRRRKKIEHKLKENEHQPQLIIN